VLTHTGHPRIRRLGVATLMTLVASLLTANGVAAAPALPTSMAAAGDSITRAFDIDWWHFLQDAPRESWSTGGDCATIRSQYCRIAAHGALTAYNDAKTGARMVDLDGQLITAAAQKAQYLTVEMGANDVCAPSIAAMTPAATVYTQAFTALGHFFAADPNAHVMVYSIPSVLRLYTAGSRNPSAVNAWRNFGICPSMLSSANTPAQRLQVDAQEKADNAALAAACAQFANCMSDGGAVYDFSFPASDLSTVDYFHPNYAGQRDAARITWGAGYWPKA
jgi:lysophospholipase L1-like esterase